MSIYSKRFEDYAIAIIHSRNHWNSLYSILERHHPPLPVKDNDSNKYMLGELSGHCVVLAYPSIAQGQGIEVATENVLKTFPSIQLHLLVGIGRGVHSNDHNIRMGDVVIGTPQGPHGSVVKYSLDAAGNIKPHGFLREPPPALLGAIYQMQLSHLLSRQTETPVSTYDVKRLFPMDPVDRTPRQYRGPAIHYGLIASGDLMNNWKTRDNILRQVDDILCFETEAARVAETYSCVTIRGISDYAESHRTGAWEEYAANAAAEATKELLSFIPQDVKSVPSGSDLVTIETGSRYIAPEIILALANEDSLRAMVKNTSRVVTDRGFSLKTYLKEYYGELRQRKQPVLPDQQAQHQLALHMVQKELDIVVDAIVQSWPNTTDQEDIATGSSSSIYSVKGPTQITSTSTRGSPRSHKISVANVSSAKLKQTEDFLVPSTTSSVISGDTLVSYSSLRDFFLMTRPFGELRYKVSRLLLQQPLMNFIHDEVWRNSPHLYSCSSIVLRVQWNLHDLVADELDGETYIGRVFAVTGDNVNVFASSCEEYFQKTWKDENYDLCSSIQYYLESNNYSWADSTLKITRLPLYDWGLIFTVKGTPKRKIAVLAQQLAWLTAALRHDSLKPSNGPSISTIRFIAGKPGEFFIEPEELIPARKEEGSCWHKLVGRARIASGFPIPSREDQIGLQLPYESMLRLGSITTELTATVSTNRASKDDLESVGNERSQPGSSPSGTDCYTAIYGISTVLYPTSIHKTPEGTVIQWHFEEKSKSRLHDLGHVKAAPAWTTLECDERQLRDWTHIVGYYPDTGIHLGQKGTNGRFTSNIAKAPPRKDSSGLGVRFKTVTAGYSPYANIAIDIIYPKSITADVTVGWYTDVLETTRQMSALLRDPVKKLTWLVPFQPVLLHMAHFWARNKQLIEPFEFAPDAQTVAGDEFLDKVEKILESSGEKKLVKEGDGYILFRQLITRFYTELRGCELARTKIKSESAGSITTAVFGRPLRGWQLLDFIIPPFPQYQLIAEGIGTCGWEDLYRNTPDDVVVLLATDLGDVIKPRSQENLCEKWKSPPEDKNLLVASIASLQQLGRLWQPDKPISTPYTRISETAGWKFSAAFNSFDKTCAGCRPFSCKAKAEALEGYNAARDSDGKNALTLPSAGAVVFGKSWLGNF